ncbi:GNAT family N-acetyltransferase [Paenibacillus glufosinatiresistens]|uniref:GNAT family N-acetyltransferase n=1 Tax=Paenibacillus glufosinatiresistens TaxID=3070657 RepID=UPI00286E3827|nr:GNAT family protein [Paenibacillus sp. YX.27]
MESALIKVRPTADKDLDFVELAERDTGNRSFIGQWTRDEHRTALDAGDMLHLIIEDRDQRRVGYCIVTGLENPHLQVCIKRIAFVDRNRGYGSELLRLVTAWLFRHTDTHRIWLDVRAHNLRAQHVYAKAGFRPEGLLRECIRIGDSFESLIVMSLLRQEQLPEGEPGQTA